MSALPELDALTASLPARADALARRLDRVMTTRVDPDGALTIDGTVVCAYCVEDTGWCAATGGTDPCEGGGRAGVDAAEAITAATVHIRLTGGHRVP